MKVKHLEVLAGMLLCASALSATPLGIMSLSSDSSGGVNLQQTRIDFFPTTNLPPNPAGTGAFATGNPTNITYGVGNSLLLNSTTNPVGVINDLDLGVGALNFITFPGSPVIFDLTGIGPGGPAQAALNGCAGAGLGVRCSPAIFGGGGFSPFVLTYNGVNTDVSLTVMLSGRDGVGAPITWKGGFTAQVGLLPGQIESLLQTPAGVISNTWSFTANSVPEPGTISILGSGLMLIGFAAWRRRTVK